MRPKKSPTRLVPIWAVDCETDPFEYGRVPIPFIWGVYEGYESKYWEFSAHVPIDPTEQQMLAGARECVAAVVDFLREQSIIAYAHNGGKFDWHFLTAHLDPTKPLLVINGRLAKFEIGKCEFRDSYNLMPISLDQYQKSRIDYRKMERAVRHLHMDDIRTYLKSDCVNLWNMVNGFEKEFGRHLTQASAAMKIWKGRFKGPAPNSGPAFYDMMHPYYYGGRVQCFEAGDFRVKARSADIVSAYPTAMLDEHPISLHYSVGPDVPKGGMSKWGPAFFSVRGVARGCFPYRGLNKMLYFPADDVKRTYHVTGWELVAALETDTLEDWDILKVYQFSEVTDFKRYVNYFWDERKKAKAAGDKGRDYYCKIFLNGLYGKFASDPRDYKQYELMPRSKLAEIIDSEKDFAFFREWLLVSEQIRREQYRFYNLATAGSITGKVRANLWRVIHGSKRPFYCDTDNVTALDYPAWLQIGKELGNWEVENHYDRLVICGKKTYAFHIEGRPEWDSLDKTKWIDPEGKPIPKNWKKATKGAALTAQDLIEIANGRLIKFLPMAPTFSVHKANPKFIPREIRMTAADVSRVPQIWDPEFVK